MYLKLFKFDFIIYLNNFTCKTSDSFQDSPNMSCCLTKKKKKRNPVLNNSTMNEENFENAKKTQMLRILKI